MAIFQSPKNIFQSPKFPGKIPEISAERAIFAKFQAPKFEISEPEKIQFHTPSHSIPPLDSLLLKTLDFQGGTAKRKKPMNIKKSGRTPPPSDRVCPVEISRLSRRLRIPVSP